MSETEHKNDIVNIVGPNRLQNDLLAKYMEDKLSGIHCIVSPQPATGSIIETIGGNHVLVLMDMTGKSSESLAEALEQKPTLKATTYYALFNLPEEDMLEENFLEQGVRGVFQENTPVDILCKGITLILKGELWYSRETMSRFLTEKQSSYSNNKQPSDSIVAQITAREKEILIRLASGASNKDIADYLCISTHTVKTHLYNLYKKINVPNRLQAALWVAKYL